MDPFSAVGLLSAGWEISGGLMNSVNSLYDLFQGTKVAEKELKSFRCDAKIYAGSLSRLNQYKTVGGDLSRIQQQDENLATMLKNILEQGDELSGRVEAFIKGFALLDKNSDGSDGSPLRVVLAKILWVRKKPGLTQLRLELMCSNLNTILYMTHLHCLQLLDEKDKGVDNRMEL
jgi:hypothetical protein